MLGERSKASPQWATYQLLSQKKTASMKTEDTLKTSAFSVVYYHSTYADSFCDKASESGISGSSVIVREPFASGYRMLIFWARLRLLTKRPTLPSH